MNPTQLSRIGIKICKKLLQNQLPISTHLDTKHLKDFTMFKDMTKHFFEKLKKPVFNSEWDLMTNL